MTLFDITQKLILEQKHGIKGGSTMEWHVTPWMRSTLPHDTVFKPSEARSHVYSDSVLCRGKMYPHLVIIQKWEEQPEYFNTYEYNKILGIDGELHEFQWNALQGHTTVELPKEIQMKTATRGIRPEEFEDPINHLHVDVQRHRLDKERKFQ